MVEYRTKLEAVKAEIAAIEAEEVHGVLDTGSESHCKKRRRS